jgi:hypothetical protein
MDQNKTQEPDQDQKWDYTPPGEVAWPYLSTWAVLPGARYQRTAA